MTRRLRALRGVAVGPFVEIVTHRNQAVLLFSGTEKGHQYRDETAAVRSSHCEHPEAFMIETGVMVMYSGQQFNMFAAISQEQGVVSNQHSDVRLISHRLQVVHDDAGTQEQQEPAPVGPDGILEAICSILEDAIA